MAYQAPGIEASFSMHTASSSEPHIDFGALAQSGSIDISVDSEIVDTLFNAAIYLLAGSTAIPGFSAGATPTSYLKTAYRPILLRHVQDVLMAYIVWPEVNKVLIRQKIATLGDPQLQRVDLFIEENRPSVFHFSVPLARPIEKIEWRRINFKAPGRKNYKDLDRQVRLFLEENLPDTERPIAIDDWVLLEIELMNPKNPQEKLLDNTQCHLWMKVGSEEADAEMRALLIGKTCGEVIFGSPEIIQLYFSIDFAGIYPYRLTIIDIIPHESFSLDLFKQFFKIKGPRDVHQKLIEVFSYRQDISQRREMAEKFLHGLALACPMHHITPELGNQQQQVILKQVQENPDYFVYKNKSDFIQRIKELAYKQIREQALIEMLAFQENLSCTQDDLRGYFNVLKKTRTKEFIYFCIENSKINDQQIPLDAAQVARFALREKALNHALAYLLKKH